MPSLFSHGHLWQQEELADVDIRLETTAGESSDGVVKDVANLIRILPGHAAILSNSPYCHAQVNRQDIYWASNAGMGNETVVYFLKLRVSSLRVGQLLRQDHKYTVAAIVHSTICCPQGLAPSARLHNQVTYYQAIFSNAFVSITSTR